MKKVELLTNKQVSEMAEKIGVECYVQHTGSQDLFGFPDYWLCYEHGGVEYSAKYSEKEVQEIAGDCYLDPATRLDDTIDCISSSNLKISLNIVFLINYLKNVDDRITELHFTNSDSAVILKNDNTLLVQMPLAVRDDM